MMKSEFINLLKKHSGETDVTDEDYAVLEHVYNYHPAIKDKLHIVKLYLDYGMIVVRDMTDRADKCQDLEYKLQEIIQQKNEINNQLFNLAN